MHEKLCIVLLIILVAPTTDVFGKEENHTVAKSHKHHQKYKSESSRMKRSLHEGNQKRNSPERAKRQSSRSSKFDPKYDSDEKSENYNHIGERINEPPFWGTRGRRDSVEENYIDTDYMPPKLQKYCHYCRNIKFCKYCFEVLNKGKYAEDSEGSWERPSRNSLSELDDDKEPFWGNRGRRQEQDEPFWGTRGRRQEDGPFWANRGRRGKSFSKSYQRLMEENEPFWGNHGRRQESEPFWGNRGRRMQDEADYENDEPEPFWGNRGRRTEDLKEAIVEAISDAENQIDRMSPIKKRDDFSGLSFWANRGRLSKLKHLFTSKPQAKNLKIVKPYEAGTILDDRIYAEEPHYILIERNSRSSAEEDPYYITRGKKKYLKTEVDQASRDRRGSIEEIVKSVRNDPYYIVRGKKNDDEIKIENTTTHDEFAKVKDLICSSINLVTSHGNKVKRETSEENERERRNILKKLAAQLQVDPYFVSRGKKSGNDNTNVDLVEEFVNQIAEKCNN